MKRFTLSLVALFVTAIAVASSPERSIRPIYLDPDAPIEERVEDALSRMTLREKIAIIHAQSKFSSPGVPRLEAKKLIHNFSSKLINRFKLIHIYSPLSIIYNAHISICYKTA